jgi:DNA-binding transcriptional ArsR family regulator
MPASVLMAIMTSEEGELTAEQLANQLGASPAAISGAVRYLSTVGMIHRHRVPGTRRYAYELPIHNWYEASFHNTELYAKVIRLGESAAPELGPRGAARVREMADFFRFLQTKLPEVLEEWNRIRAGRPSN